MYTLTNDAKQRIYLETGEHVTLDRLEQVFIESGSTSNRSTIRQELQNLYETLPTRE